MKKISKEQKLGVVLAFIGLIIIIPQSYATYYNIEVSRFEAPLIELNIRMSDMLALSTIQYNQAVSDLQVYTIYLISEETDEEFKSLLNFFNISYLQLITEAIEKLEKAKDTLSDFTEMFEEYEKIALEYEKLTLEVTIISFEATLISISGGVFGVLYVAKLYVFDKGKNKKSIKRKTKKK